MDYTKLAEEFLHQMYLFRKGMLQKRLNQSMQGETFILQYLAAAHEDGVIPSNISNEMGISSARIAAALNSLENKGLITRRIDVSDRRRILVHLAPAGQEQAEQHKQAILSAITQMFQFLGRQDAEEYIRITGRLTEMCQNRKE